MLLSVSQPALVGTVLLASSMTIQLPLEILTAIVKKLDDVQDLRNVRMACRYLCAAITPIAFRTLYVIATKRSAQNLGRLLDLPSITAHVREVTFNDTGADGRGFGGRVLNYGVSSTPSFHNNITNCVFAPRFRLITVRSDAIQELEKSFSRIHRLSRLETIDFTFYPINDCWAISDGGSRIDLQMTILGALATSFRDCIPSKLTSLSLQNLRTLDLPSFESPSFQNLLKTLQHFQLSVLSDIPPNDRTFRVVPSGWSHFWGTVCPRMVLAPMQHALRELTLHSNAFVGASSGTSLTGLHFPHLHALSLRSLVFEPSIGVEPFILRHANSLAKLELLSCKLPTYTGVTWIPSPPPSDQCWDSIWNRFATELTSLVSLHVDDPECPYVFGGLGLFFYLDSNRESRDATDVVALERFHMVVAARLEEVCGES